MRISSGKPVTIMWGDGASTKVLSHCTVRQARVHPRACGTVAHHAYSSAGVFRIVVTRSPRAAFRTVLRVATAAVTQPHASPPPAAPAPTAEAAWRAEMLSRVNALRAAVGASPVTMCSPLTAAAQDYSGLMASTNYYGHVGPDGSEPWDRMSAHGYNWRGAGENIAVGYQRVDEVMTAWRNSAGHYANIIKPGFTHVGFGRATSTNEGARIYWVQDFGYGGTCGQ
jgi:uncharacterized protein YkwD